MSQLSCLSCSVLVIMNWAYLLSRLLFPRFSFFRAVLSLLSCLCYHVLAVLSSHFLAVFSQAVPVLFPSSCPRCPVYPFKGFYVLTILLYIYTLYSMSSSGCPGATFPSWSRWLSCRNCPGCPARVVLQELVKGHTVII
jgi:hypothetical protein